MCDVKWFGAETSRTLVRINRGIGCDDGSEEDGKLVSIGLPPSPHIL
jgi:hypothetical protein